MRVLLLYPVRDTSNDWFEIYRTPTQESSVHSMKVERQPQVLGLSRATRSGPTMEIKASEASEVLMSLFLMTGDCDYDTYDLPSERLSAIKDSGIPAPLRAEIDELIAGSEVVAALVGLVAELPGALDIPA